MSIDTFQESYNLCKAAQNTGVKMYLAVLFSKVLYCSCQFPYALVL